MIRSLNQILSFFLELAMLAAFCYTGFHLAVSPVWQYILGIGVPVMVLIFWAKKMAPKASKQISYPGLLWISLLLFEAAAVALFFVGQKSWAMILAILAVINIGLRFLWEEKRKSKNNKTETFQL